MLAAFPRQKGVLFPYAGVSRVQRVCLHVLTYCTCVSVFSKFTALTKQAIVLGRAIEQEEEPQCSVSPLSHSGNSFPWIMTGSWVSEWPWRWGRACNHCISLLLSSAFLLMLPFSFSAHSWFSFSLLFPQSHPFVHPFLCSIANLLFPVYA